MTLRYASCYNLKFFQPYLPSVTANGTQWIRELALSMTLLRLSRSLSLATLIGRKLVDGYQHMMAFKLSSRLEQVGRQRGDKYMDPSYEL